MQCEQQTQKTPRKLWSADSPKQSLLESLLSVRSKWRMLVRLLPKQRSPSSKSFRSMHTIGTANSLFYIPQPSSDDESCRLERIATNSIHSKQRLNTMQIETCTAKNKTQRKGKSLMKRTSCSTLTNASCSYFTSKKEYCVLVSNIIPKLENIQNNDNDNTNNALYSYST